MSRSALEELNATFIFCKCPKIHQKMMAFILNIEFNQPSRCLWIHPSSHSQSHFHFRILHKDITGLDHFVQLLLLHNLQTSVTSRSYNIKFKKKKPLWRILMPLVWPLNAFYSLTVVSKVNTFLLWHDHPTNTHHNSLLSRALPNIRRAIASRKASPIILLYRQRLHAPLR